MKDIIKKEIEKNEIIVKNMEAQTNELGDKRVELANQMQKIREGNLKELFDEMVGEFGIETFENYEGCYSFRAAGTSDKFGSALFSIYSRNRSFGEVQFGKELNYYTTTCEDDFEFNRLIALGRVAKFVKTISAEGLFNAINSGTDELKAQEKELKKQVEALRSVIRESQRQIENLTQELIEGDLMKDGVEFSTPKHLSVGNKIDRFDVVKVRITKKSASGKTCDVEVTTESRIYDFENSKYKDEVQRYTTSFDRVKTQELIFRVKHIVEATSNLS